MENVGFFSKEDKEDLSRKLRLELVQSLTYKFG